MRHLLAQRRFAALICVAALLMKLLVPTGYMVSDDHGTITVSICSGVAPRTMTMTMTMTMAMPGMGAAMASLSDHAPASDHGKVEMPCAFAGLAAPLLGAVDPALLLVALAVVAALALLAVARPALPPAPYLRPPLRGPPSSI